MKKILSLISFVLIAFAAHAEEDVIIKPTCAQVGTTAKVAIVVKHDPSRGAGPAAATLFTYSIPDGTILTGISKVAGDLDYNPLNCMVLADSFGEATEGKPDGAVICYLEIEIPEDMAVGEYPIALTDVQIVYDDGETDFTLDRVESTLTVQKTAVIEPQRGDYAFEAVPTCVATGATSMSLPVNFANEGYVDNISFNIEYPAGMLTTKVGKNYNLTVNKDRFDTGSDATLTVKATSGTAVSFTNGDLDLVKPDDGNLLTIPVTLTNVADGVYTIKFTDIKVSVTNDEADPISTETLPDYYVSVIVGQPSTQEAILYGNYNEATASAFTTALKNVAIADVTAATVDDGAKFTDVLVNEKGGKSYYTRTSANYGTTVLPLDLTTEKVDKLYTVESMDANSIVIAEAEQVPANTPCIFKGTINVEGATPTLGATSEQLVGGTIFKGTYVATSIDAGAGYYISSNGKFYNDGASIRPFRAYFEGTVEGAKSFSVLIDTPDGLKDITDQFSKEDIYNLQGIRMNNVQKGINIKGGKKVLVK